jgi:hypothetical protein
VSAGKSERGNLISCALCFDKNKEQEIPPAGSAKPRLREYVIKEAPPAQGRQPLRSAECAMPDANKCGR